MGKLSPRYIRALEIILTLGEVAFELALPPDFLVIHLVFHIFILGVIF